MCFRDLNLPNINRVHGQLTAIRGGNEVYSAGLRGLQPSSPLSTFTSQTWHRMKGGTKTWGRKPRGYRMGLLFSLERTWHTWLWLPQPWLWPAIWSLWFIQSCTHGPCRFTVLQRRTHPSHRCSANAVFAGFGSPLSCWGKAVTGDILGWVGRHEFLCILGCWLLWDHKEEPMSYTSAGPADWKTTGLVLPLSLYLNAILVLRDTRFRY